MSSSRLLGVTAVLSTVTVTPVAAQRVISEPGYCAQFYPNANCQNKGPGNPYTDPNFHRYQAAPGWSGGETVGTVPKPTRTYRSGFHHRAHAPALGRDTKAVRSTISVALVGNYIFMRRSPDCCRPPEMDRSLQDTCSSARFGCGLRLRPFARICREPSHH